MTVSYTPGNMATRFGALADGQKFPQQNAVTLVRWVTNLLEE
jgi:hypothetical protein